MMHSFWLVASLLAITAAFLVVLPLWRAPDLREQNTVSLNRRVFQERMAELEKDLSDGRIDAAMFGDLRTELQRNLLLLNTPDAAPSFAPEKNAPEKTAPEKTALEKTTAKKSTQKKLPTEKKSTNTPRIALAVCVMIFLPLSALSFYHTVVQPKGLGEWWQLKNTLSPTVTRLLQGQAPTAAETAGHSLADLVRVLQSHLQQHPKDAEAWFMVGLSYVQMDMPQPAQLAFERAYKLDSTQLRYELSYAQTLVFSNDGQLTAQSHQLLNHVLQKQPDHEGAMLLLGLGAYRSGDFLTAVNTLERLQKIRAARRSNHEPAAMQSVAETLKAARAALNASAAGGEKVPVAGAAVIRVKVQVDRALMAKFSADDALYIFARALNGSPMPVAVVKRRAADLPLLIELSDKNSMMPTRLLSGVPELLITARISRHGSPEPQAGDIEAIAVPLRQNGGAQSVDLLLQSVRQ